MPSVTQRQCVLSSNAMYMVNTLSSRQACT